MSATTIESECMETTLMEAIASGDVPRIRHAVTAWAAELRAANEDARVFAEDCAPLLGHPSFKIRQDVAATADIVPEDVFDSWLATFSADEDNFVRAAITNATRKRALRRKRRERQGVHDNALAAIFHELETKYGKGARRLAERAVRRGTSTFMQRLHHEATKIMTPLDFSLTQVRSEVARPELDRPMLTRNVGMAWERCQHLWSVLTRARQAMETVTPRFQNEALLALVEEARAQLTTRVAARAARLVFTVDVEPSLRLDIDRSALLQALQNFLQNAVEAYGEDAPELAVSVTARTLRAGSQVELAIVDRGSGMGEDLRDHMFVPFGSRKPGGTGVGLLIARAMVEEVHGGSLRIESARGAGTTVTVVLPVKQAGRRAS